MLIWYVPMWVAPTIKPEDGRCKMGEEELKVNRDCKWARNNSGKEQRHMVLLGGARTGKEITFTVRPGQSVPFDWVSTGCVLHPGYVEVLGGITEKEMIGKVRAQVDNLMESGLCKLDELADDEDDCGEVLAATTVKQKARVHDRILGRLKELFPDVVRKHRDAVYHAVEELLKRLHRLRATDTDSRGTVGRRKLDSSYMPRSMNPGRVKMRRRTKVCLDTSMWDN